MTRRLALLLLPLAACPDPIATTDTPTSETTGSPSTGPSPTPTTDITTVDITTDITATTEIATTTDISTTTDITTDDTTGHPPVQPCLALPAVLGVEWSLTDAELAAGKLVATPAGDFALMGTVGPPLNTNVLVELRDPDGALQWSDTYAGIHGLDDRAVDIAVDATGHLHVLLAETVSSVQVEQGALADEHLVILRYAPDGTHVWRWEQPHEHGPPPVSRITGGVLQIVGDDIAVLEHFTYENGPRVLHTLDRFGNHLGAVTLALPDGLKAYKLRTPAIASDGTVVLTGEDYEPANAPQRVWLGRFAADGTLAWSTVLGDADDKPESLVLQPNGDIVLVWNERLGPNNAQRHVQRWQRGPDPAWTLDLEDAVTVSNGAFHCDGTLLLTGGITKPAGPDLEWNERSDLWLGVVSPTGQLTGSFEHAFGPPYSYGSAHSVATTNTTLLVAASYLADDGMHYDPWLARLTP